MRSISALRCLVAAALISTVAGCHVVLPSQPSPAGDVPPHPTHTADANPSDRSYATRYEVVGAYVAALRARDFARAWAFLGPQTRRGYGSLEEFAQYQRAVLRDAHDNIVVRPPTFGSPNIDEWWPNIEDPDIDRDRAGLVELFYPDLPDSPADWEMYIVAPDGQGLWRMWLVR
jgi:hypothetical protein